MKAALALVASVATLAASPAYGDSFITDTLGGNGHARHAHVQGYTFITDTLGGNGRARHARVQGYTFITDTLAPGGGPVALTVSAPRAFDWGDAGVGASVTAGSLLLLLGGSVLVQRRRSRLAA
jgi:hypothetical protein